MAMANMNLIGVFVTKFWPVQALACGGGDGGSETAAAEAEAAAAQPQTITKIVKFQGYNKYI